MGKSESYQSQRKRYKRRRAWLIKYFGSCCHCCGESEYLFLMFDHVNDDGAEHRRSLTGKNKVGFHLVNDLYLKIANKAPIPKIQLLCANCNTGRARNSGICPHASDSQR